MQFFINEVSLQGQYIDQESFRQAIQIFLSILNNIKEIKSYFIYKDSQTFINYQAVKNQNFQQSLNNISDQSIARAFKNILYNKINPQDWRNERLHKEDDNFDYRDTSLAEVAERTIQIKEQIYLVLNGSIPFL
jgi:AraC-like DNA-binding protein